MFAQLFIKCDVFSVYKDGYITQYIWLTISRTINGIDNIYIFLNLKNDI